MSRIREYRLASDQAPADDGTGVALRLAGTARVITAAALIMAISFAALGGAQVSLLRMLGVGLTPAVLPFMHMMGRFNWWAPKSLVRLHERAGIREVLHAPTGSGVE